MQPMLKSLFTTKLFKAGLSMPGITLGGARTPRTATLICASTPTRVWNQSDKPLTDAITGADK
ncbi:hypothetical protein [Caulobacter sp. Root655]|uniref:hypothetical protein n=1 Tax=Caulobacter sp. Root655 TaxID=1736578 RepID=UPI0012E35B9B|nr:hypothetical protein [Caulobacter sp. Root655]